MPFVDLKAQYQTIKAEIHEAINRVLESSSYVLGEEVTAFEEEFAAYSEARCGIAVNSGTSAIHLALLAARIGPGDEVITVPFTFVATAAAILYVGARPVFVDIDPQSFTIDVNQIEPAITPRTKAILPVHLYGQPADMDPILDIARRHGLVVIEDAAQAHGAEYKGKRVGGLGDLGCFSFYPAKNLGAYGEGGMVVTNNPEYDHTIRILRDWGQDSKYHHVCKGTIIGWMPCRELCYGSNCTFWKLGPMHDDRTPVATTQQLAGCTVETPQAMAWARHVYHLYAIRTPSRDGSSNISNVMGSKPGFITRSLSTCNRDILTWVIPQGPSHIPSAQLWKCYPYPCIQNYPQ